MTEIIKRVRKFPKIKEQLKKILVVRFLEQMRV